MKERRHGLLVLCAGSALLMAEAFPPRERVDVAFACRVEGEALLVPAATKDEVCELVRRAVDAALGAETRLVDQQPAAIGVERLRVDVRFARPGIASAQMTRARDGTVTTFPDLNIAVSDHPLGLSIVKKLAEQLATQLR